MSGLLTRGLAVVALLFLGVFLAGPAPVAAETYTYTEVANFSSQTCGTVVTGAVTQTNCFVAFLAPAGLVLNAGDVVNLDITFGTPATVSAPGSNTQSSLFAVLLDNQYGNCHSATPTNCFSDSTTWNTTLPGYSGPSGLSTTGTFSLNNYFVSYAALNGPNSGFSATGIDATFDINTSDPNAIQFFAVETQTINTAPTATPEPSAVVLSGAGLGLFLVFRRFFPSRTRLAA
jgi:hypothetical protein